MILKPRFKKYQWKTLKVPSTITGSEFHSADAIVLNDPNEGNRQTCDEMGTLT